MPAADLNTGDSKDFSHTIYNHVIIELTILDLFIKN